MFSGLRELAEEFGDKDYQPTPYENTLFLFLEKGISLEEFNRLPIPYILSMQSTAVAWAKKQEESLKKKEHGSSYWRYCH